MGDSGALIRSKSNCINTRACLTICTNCNHLNWAGFPAGVRFAPSDQQLIEHLESMVLVKEDGGSRAHALINYFIPTIEEDIGICYTHPENLPGVTRDGHSKYFFHRISKAYRTSSRTRRKIMSDRGQHSSEDIGEAHWHQTGNVRPVIMDGRQKGCKKILVLHNVKHGKREKTNWVMHQYHLGVSEEKDGELVVSKVFYSCPDATMVEQNDEMVPVSSATAVTAANVTMVPLQQYQPKRQAHSHGLCNFAPAEMFQEASVGDPVSGDQGQVRGNNNHITSQHRIHSQHMESDTILSAQVGVGDPVSEDQGQVHGSNDQIPSQHQVQSVVREPDTTLSLALSTGWFR